MFIIQSITSPITLPNRAFHPTLLKYHQMCMRSIFISARPLIDPMVSMLPPIAEQNAITFQYVPFWVNCSMYGFTTLVMSAML